MSWDFSMQIDAGGAEPINLDYEANATYNLAPMYYEAFGSELLDPSGEGWGGVRALHGMTGEDALPHLARAIERMKIDPAKYRAMNPKNGWGDYEGALRVLQEIYEWCCEAPKAVLRVT